MKIENLISKTVINFNEKIVALPFPIYLAEIQNNFIFILFDGYISAELNLKLRNEEKIRLLENDLKVLNEYIEIINQNIWCFDLEGNLKWKIPKAYTQEKDQREIDRVGHAFITNYVSMRFEEENVLLAGTAYGNKIRVNIETGELLSASEGTPW